MTRLGMGWQGNTFKINGIEASGTVDMDDLFRMDVEALSGNQQLSRNGALRVFAGAGTYTVYSRRRQPGAKAHQKRRPDTRYAVFSDRY
jgi:hypothetical protein